jgi:serine/threonine protein kinase
MDSSLVSADFEVGKLIGKGGFAQVYEAHRRINGEKVAIKFCSKESRSKASLRTMRREYEALRSFKHPNIIRTLDYYENDRFIAIVLEHCEGGDLCSFVRYAGKNATYESDVANILRGVAKGLDFIHNSCNALHRDIKPRTLASRREHPRPLQPAQARRRD